MDGMRRSQKRWACNNQEPILGRIIKKEYGKYDEYQISRLF